MDLEILERVILEQGILIMDLEILERVIQVLQQVQVVLLVQIQVVLQQADITGGKWIMKQKKLQILMI